MAQLIKESDIWGTCIVCGDRFVKCPDFTWATTPDGEVCPCCVGKLIEEHWDVLKPRLELKGAKK